jgi:hypothetical protein
MSKKVAPRVQLNFAPQGESSAEEISDEELLDSSEVEHAGGLPCDLPEVPAQAVERKEIVDNDIFDIKIQEQAEQIQAEQTQAVIEEAEPKPKPKVKSKAKAELQPKKKRQLSEEHKAKLALAREKALVTRRKKAEEKKKMKEIENKTKELKKKKAQKDLEQLEDEVIHDKPSKPTFVNQGSMFTKEDLENAQLDAIMKYETIRKARKEEKRKQQMIEQQKKDLQKKIQGYGARDSSGRLLNKWDRCY